MKKENTTKNIALTIPYYYSDLLNMTMSFYLSFPVPIVHLPYHKKEINCKDNNRYRYIKPIFPYSIWSFFMKIYYNICIFAKVKQFYISFNYIILIHTHLQNIQHTINLIFIQVVINQKNTNVHFEPCKTATLNIACTGI